MGQGKREELKNVILGSIHTWAADPAQPVNYLESHDDMTLADELSTVPGHDARTLLPLDVKANRLAVTILSPLWGSP